MEPEVPSPEDLEEWRPQAEPGPARVRIRPAWGFRWAVFWFGPAVISMPPSCAPIATGAMDSDLSDDEPVHPAPGAKPAAGTKRVNGNNSSDVVQAKRAKAAPK